MTYRLTKHHGLGNDFLVHLTDDRSAVADGAPWIERAVHWCHRTRGIGADGLLLGVHGTGDADLVMTLVNADGSIAEMSGNGIRCLAHAEARRRDEAAGELTILTDAGPRRVTYRPDEDGDPAAIVAAVDMGPATPGPDPDREIAEVIGSATGPEAAALGADARRSVTLDVGNPHLVLLVDDPELVDLVAAGTAHEAAFEAGINVHFVAPAPQAADTIEMRVWERGAGVTEACGTGATAVARAVYDWGLTGQHVTVRMPGGEVAVDVGDSMVLHGPAVHIADVEVAR